MKARIVTFNRAYNYGAVLQCYALARVLAEKCVDCDVLDYFPDEFKYVYYLKKKPLSLKHRLYKMACTIIKNRTPKRYLKNRNEKNIFHSVLNERNINFDAFIKSNIPLTDKTICSKKELELLSSDRDCYIAGSDQIWHNKWCNFDSTFFLDFPDANNKKKFSYAASFGMDKLPEELISEYKRRLENFDMISVRESSGAKLVNKLVNKETVVSCDPTLLLPVSDWDKLCDCKAVNEPYILVYFTEGSKDLQNRAKDISEKTGYKVISLPCTVSQSVMSGTYDAPYGFDVRAESGPSEFLNLFRNAEYVLTNTFHGTVFSIIFHKQFLTAYTLPNKKKSIRVIELLDKLGISERDLMDENNDIDKETDWDKVENNLSELRTESMQYINNIIETVENWHRQARRIIKNEL